MGNFQSRSSDDSDDECVGDFYPRLVHLIRVILSAVVIFKWP